MSSLGVGDPENLAKNLDSILSLVPGDDDDKDEVVEMKTPPPVVIRKTRKPRLIEDIALKSVKKLPKIQVEQAEPTSTPNKFFKSRSKVDVESSPFVTPSIAASSTKRSSRVASSKAATAGGTVDIYSDFDENVKPIKNLKSIGKFEIFEDSSALKTPVRGVKEDSSTSVSSSRKLGTRSSRKLVPPEKQDDVFSTPAPASSRKPSTRTSTRKTRSKPELESVEDASSAAAVSSTTKRSTRKTKTEDVETETPSTTTSSSRRALRRL